MLVEFVINPVQLTLFKKFDGEALPLPLSLLPLPAELPLPFAMTPEYTPVELQCHASR